MHVQIVNFNLNDVSRQDYEISCNDIAQAFADLPGLQSKHWLVEEEGNTYGGVYFFGKPRSHAKLSLIGFVQPGG